MSLTLLRNGLEIDLARRVASGRFLFDERADLPARGASAAWVQVAGEGIGGGWAVDAVEVEGGVLPVCRITARQAGHHWTWVDAAGDPLAPIETRGSYRLVPASKLVGGQLKLGYWNYFGNFPAAAEWLPEDADPLRDRLRTWEIEFVARTPYDNWRRRVNGTWPTGITPPVGGAGVFWCRSLEILAEPWRDPANSSSVPHYRHFAVFWQAPSYDQTQLTWLFSDWDA